MKTIKLVLASLILASTSLAQGLTIPKHYNLITESDFDKYEHTVTKCANFLINTPVNQKTNLRAEAAKFLIDYVSKSPTIKVELNQNVTPFISNVELSTIYLASWVKSYSAQNHINNKEEFTIRAANETLNYYSANKSKIGKVSDIKKFLKLQANGKLENHIKSSL